MGTDALVEAYALQIVQASSTTTIILRLALYNTVSNPTRYCGGMDLSGLKTK